MDINLSFVKNHSGLKYIKTDTLPTLLPLSIVQKNQLTDTLSNQQVPIFLDTKKDTFIVFLCDDFLIDISNKEISSISSKVNVVNDTGEKSYIRFDFNSLQDIRNSFSNQENALFQFKELYDNHILDIQNGEMVIMLCFKNRQSISAFHSLSHIHNDDIKKAITGSSSVFEFFKAFRFNEKYYLLNIDETIDQKSVFKLDKNSEQNLNYLVMKYTAEDWDMVNNIYSRINDIKEKINTIFENQKEHTTGLLDKSFSETNHPLLENFTTGKKVKA